MTRCNEKLNAIVAAGFAIATLCAAGAVSSPLLAQSEVPSPIAEIAGTARLAQLDEAGLLKALRDADPADAPRVERELQALWAKSGSPSMDLLLRRGRDAFQRGELDVAIEHLTALTDHAPDFAEGWSTRASVFAHAGRFGLAVADLEHALALNPNDYNAIFGLGQVFEMVQDPEHAYEAYLRAKAIHPHHDEVGKALDRLAAQVEGEAL